MFKDVRDARLDADSAVRINVLAKYYAQDGENYSMMVELFGKDSVDKSKTMYLMMANALNYDKRVKITEDPAPKASLRGWSTLLKGYFRPLSVRGVLLTAGLHINRKIHMDEFMDMVLHPIKAAQLAELAEKYTDPTSVVARLALNGVVGSKLTNYFFNERTPNTPFE